MRILGLDVGSRTVGVAVSDPMGWTAQGVEIIRINEDEKEFGLDRLGEIIKEKNAHAVVLGLPKNMNNSEGPRAEASRAYAKMVEDRFGLPTDFQDERLTTVQAERMLIEEADVSRKKRKQVIDKIAAEFILKNYLDANGKLTKL
ncbi:Holliday junction resolvase RuvX [Fructobacillus sp. CRL 2054]|uniref:Holliday junction resolvase RuvX n=1 Tax=Fructobacillus sp. CRL 2054 TaxID=2763007 RepID=UPI00237A07C4|nr:Holliday junction resolvase RuvX [Fructobacillus sp. CRL 2054]MDD9138177.1 Holliday junction resolvase RuvX [Fructobacillus sp. CRL 2054]